MMNVSKSLFAESDCCGVSENGSENSHTPSSDDGCLCDDIVACRDAGRFTVDIDGARDTTELDSMSDE